MKSIFVLIISLSFVLRMNAEGSASGKTKYADQKADTLIAKQDSAAADSINVSRLVQMQIDAARKKALEGKNNPPIKVEMKNAEVNTGSISMLENSEEDLLIKVRKLLPVSDEVFIKILIIFVFSALMLGTVFIKRKISRKKNNDAGVPNGSRLNGKSKSLKDNISMIREERPFRPGKKNKAKLLIRKKLVESAPVRISQEAAARSARELQISQGEILLAARLKSHRFEK